MFGCARPSVNKGVVAEPPAQPQTTPFDDLPYRQGPIHPSTRIMLVAGGNDIANFAAEVVEQRALWKKAGVADDAIACYYAKPTAKAFRSSEPVPA